MEADVLKLEKGVNSIEEVELIKGKLNETKSWSGVADLLNKLRWLDEVSNQFYVEKIKDEVDNLKLDMSLKGKHFDVMDGLKQVCNDAFINSVKEELLNKESKSLNREFKIVDMINGKTSIYGDVVQPKVVINPEIFLLSKDDIHNEIDVKRRIMGNSEVSIQEGRNETNAKEEIFKLDNKIPKGINNVESFVENFVGITASLTEEGQNITERLFMMYKECDLGLGVAEVYRNNAQFVHRVTKIKENYVQELTKRVIEGGDLSVLSSGVIFIV